MRAIAALTLFLLAGSVLGQAYPNRPILMPNDQQAAKELYAH